MQKTDIFRQAALLQLNTSCWVGSKALKRTQLESISDSGWLKGKKLLINPELLGAIRTTIHKARQCIARFALPFPLAGMNLVPKDVIEDLDAHLSQIKEEYWAKVDAFVAQYAFAREEAKIALCELFNESDYPVDIMNKFRFQWRFLLLDVPDKASVLTPDILRRERRKFEELMHETRELSIAALREEFGEIVSHLVDRLSGDDGKQKAFRSNMVNRINEFLDSFGDKNLFGDETLAALVDQARSIVKDMGSGYAIQYNELHRQRIASEMSRLKQGIDAAIEELPRRRVLLESALATSAVSDLPVSTRTSISRPKPAPSDDPADHLEVMAAA